MKPSPIMGTVAFILATLLWPNGLLSEAVKITGISVKPMGETTEVTIAGTDSLTYRHFLLDSPPRIVLDLPGTWNDLVVKKHTDLNRGGIRSIRTSQYQDDITRVVLDLDRIYAYSVFPGHKRVVVVFDNPWERFEPWETGAAGEAPEEAGTSEAGLSGAEEGISEAAAETSEAGADSVETMEIFQESPPRRISVDFQDADIHAVVRAFSEFSGVSIVAGKDVQGQVTAKILDQPWDRAFSTLMRANGYGVVYDDGIYRVDKLEVLQGEESLVMLKPTVFRLNYINPKDILETIQSLLSQRGQVKADVKSNSIVVADVPERIALIKEVIPQLDVKTEQVMIQSKLIFVNSVELTQIGINWHATNLMDPTTDTHGEVITGQSVSDPFLQLSYGTFLSGTNITGLLEALEEKQMIDVQAQPQITTLDNLEAQVFVGEKTPIRVLDIGAETQAAASIQLIETGIKLTVTPHVTNDRKIIMDLKAERSNAVPVPTEFGVEFQTQEGKTTLMVDDGQTAVIGGLTTVDTIKTRRGIPLLSRIPLIGNLFKYWSDRLEKRDLLILVTPIIVS